MGKKKFWQSVLINNITFFIKIMYFKKEKAI